MKFIKYVFTLYFLVICAFSSKLIKETNLTSLSEVKSRKDSMSNEWKTNLDEYKKSVVMIEIESELQFFDENSTMSLATGFIIDKELGLIATNKHVTRRSPSRHKIKFYDGSVYMGNVVYYDIFHDFGIIQIKNYDQLKKDLKFYNYLKPVKMTSSYSLKKGSEIFLIGNNEGVNYSVKTGNILQTNVPDSFGFGSLIQTSFDRTGGSSGSPVWDYDGNVVAIHAMGDSISSLEVPIDYIVDAYNYILRTHTSRKESIENQTVNLFDYDKGFIGALITTVPLFKIKRLVMNIPQNNKNLSLINNLLNSQNSTQTQKENTEVILIQNVMEDSPAFNKIRAGDVLLKINEDIVGNDLIKYEKKLDLNINKQIKFKVFRFGELLSFDIQVAGTKNEKIKEFIMIKNTIFHDLKLGYRLKYDFMKEGVYISQIGLSSPFSDITPENIKNSKTDGNILFLSMNSNKISNIESLIETFNNICDRSNLYIEAIDLNYGFSRPDIYPIDFGDIMNISKFTFDEVNGGWKNTNIVLKSCENKLKHRKITLDKSREKLFFNKFYSRMKEIKKFNVKSFKLFPI